MSPRKGLGQQLANPASKEAPKKSTAKAAKKKKK